MRTFATYLLTALLLACPFLCQAAQADFCVEPSTAAEGTHGDSHAPLPCPEDGVSCICAGAVNAPDLRLADLAPDFEHPSLDSWFLASFSPPLFPLGNHLARDGTSEDVPQWGQPHRVHALYQNFRC